MTDKKLDKLQELLVDELIAQIESGEAKPSTLNVARQMLKDQGYEFINTQSPLVDVMENLPFEQKEVLTAFKKQG